MKRPNIKCPYCGSQAFLRPASVLGKTGPAYEGKQFYVCARYPRCNSYVPAHKGSRLPMGTLANPRLRWLRHETHLIFDRLWQDGYMETGEAYRWLQTQLGIPESDAHIGMFSEYRCNEVIRLCDGFLSAVRAA